MQTISCIDLDGDAKKQLESHLLSDDFFGTNFYPTAELEILETEKKIDDNYTIVGVITIKGIKKDIKKMWGEMKGEKLKTSPKGFDKEHPANDLLQYKQYIFSKKVDHKTIFSHEFETFIIDHFKTLLPVLNYMGEVLNTNLDGESLL